VKSVHVPKTLFQVFVIVKDRNHQTFVHQSNTPLQIENITKWIEDMFLPLYGTQIACHLIQVKNKIDLEGSFEPK
jgi:hypothetical protein